MNVRWGLWWGALACLMWIQSRAVEAQPTAADAGTGTESETEAESETGTESESESESGSETGSEAEAEPEPEPGSDSGSVLEYDPVLDADQPEPPVEHASSEVGVGLVLALGLHTGAAAGVRLGLGDFGLELLGGYQPLLAFSDDGSREMDVDLGSSAQLGAELTFMPWHPKKSSAIGLKGGYRYNSVLEHGFAAALAFMVDLGESVALQVCAGGSFFPGQEQTLRDELNVPEENDLAYASNAQFFELGFELIWLP